MGRLRDSSKMFTFLSALTSGSALAPLFQSLYYFQRNAHCLNGPCTPGSFGGGVWHEVSYEWNSPKEANKAVGYGPWAHIGTLGAPPVAATTSSTTRAATS